MSSSRLRLLTAVLLVASAALFAIGVAIERHDNRSETRHAQAPPAGRLLFADADQNGSGAETKPGRHESSREHRSRETPARPGGHAPAEPNGETGKTHESSGGESPTEHAREHNSELVFGVNTESTPLVIAAVAVSLILAAALLASDALVILAAVLGFALVAAAFDIREAFHQADESRTNLIAIAAAVAALHVAIAASAAALARRRATAAH
jgi:hypothetical protein